MPRPFNSLKLAKRLILALIACLATMGPFVAGAQMGADPGAHPHHAKAHHKKHDHGKATPKIVAGGRFTPCGRIGTRKRCTFEGKRVIRLHRGSRTVDRVRFGKATCDAATFGVSDAQPGDRCEYSEVLRRTVTPAMSQTHSGHDMSMQSVSAPLGFSGHRGKRVRRATAQMPPSPSRAGAFRVVCTLAKMAFTDPIVFPRQPGAGHLHAFFGNTRVTANSTPATIAKKGRSTCAGGILDRSAYWVPAVLDGRTAVLPSFMRVYYKSGIQKINPTSIKNPPQGLVMVAGDSDGRHPMPWARWQCQTSSPPIKNLSVSRTIPTTCPAGALVMQNVHFPQCWDGKKLDSADHRSHMAYGKGDCPPDHPVAIPAISYVVAYIVPADGSVRRWRLSSDHAGMPGGTANHADFVDGWDPDIVKAFVKNCVTAPADCHGRLLGDGRELF